MEGAESDPLLTPLPLPELNKILCEQMKFYEKSLCKILSVLVKNDIIMTQ